MATKKAETPTFDVFFSIKVDVSVPIKGSATFENALIEARKLKALDILDDGDRSIQDYETTLTGIYKS